MQEQRTLCPHLHHDTLAANIVAAELTGRKAALLGDSGFISPWTSPRSPPRAAVCAMGPNALHSERGGTAWGQLAIAAAWEAVASVRDGGARRDTRERFCCWKRVLLKRRTEDIVAKQKKHDVEQAKNSPITMNEGL